MEKVMVVIGANYGDEGKGLVTSYLTKINTEADSPVFKTLNILNNGGAQRGHTVIVDRDGTKYRHVFNHFGSGTFNGAITYFSKYFILNPMVFTKEYKQLSEMKKAFVTFGVMNLIYRDVNCQWSTPYDAIVNQESEVKDDHKNGTCGLGIWETVKRYRSNKELILKFGDFMTLSKYDKVEYLLKIRKYYEKECKNRGLLSNKFFYKAFYSKALIDHFLEDCEFIYEHTDPIENFNDIKLGYKNVIFENGQGLCIGSRGFDEPHRTPSYTGIKNIVDFMLENKLSEYDIDVYYVTRSYLTRHGNGVLPGECNKSTISKSIKDDETNVYNQWQGKFRYAPMRFKSLIWEVEDDADYIKRDPHNNYNIKYAMTHLDELDNSEFLVKYADLENDELLKFFSPVY